MKRITWLIIAALLVMTSSAFAQLKDFDLSAYKLPVFKSQMLDLTFYGYSNSNVDNELLPINDQTSIKLSNCRGQMDVGYRFDQNSKMVQRSFNAILCGDYYYQYRNYGSYDQYTHQTNPRLSLGAMNRRYNKFGSFFETGIMLNSENRYYHDYRVLSDATVDERTLIYQKELTFEAPFKFGKGRIERIDDARRAIYILQALQDVDRLDREVSDQDVLELATLLSTLREGRVFDTRLSYMSNLKDVNDFLVSQALVSTIDASYFVNLDDMFRYGYNTTRYSGKKIAFVIQPSALSDNLNNMISDNNSNQIRKALDGGVEYTYENPINLSWQESVNAFLYGGVCNSNSIATPDTIADISNVVNYRMGMEHRFAYYPNSRTNIEFFYGINYVNFVAAYDKEWAHLLDGGELFEGRLGVEAEYYISPKLSIDAFFGFMYEWTISNTSIHANFGSSNSADYYMSLSSNPINQHSLYTNFSIRLSYSIF